LIISFAFYTTIPVKTTQTLLVPQGSIGHIITQLTKQGYALSPIDKYILVFMGQPQSGWVNIGANKLNRIDFLYKLTTAKAKMEKVTLIPGETTELFLDMLAKEHKLDRNKLSTYFKEFAQYPEAAIFADTYYVPYGITEKHLIYFLVNESEKRYKKLSKKIYGNYRKKEMAGDIDHRFYHPKRSSEHQRDAHCLFSYLQPFEKRDETPDGWYTELWEILSYQSHS
jgi:UPF0755 protein